MPSHILKLVPTCRPALLPAHPHVSTLQYGIFWTSTGRQACVYPAGFIITVRYAVFIVLQRVWGLAPQASCNDSATTQRWRRPSTSAVGTNIGLKIKYKVLYVPVGRQVGTKTDLNIDIYIIFICLAIYLNWCRPADPPTCRPALLPAHPHDNTL